MSSTVITHSLQPRRAFHSTLSTKFALNPPSSDCSFFALYTFPQSIIIDTCELVDHGLSAEFWGESNLELPVFALNPTTNALLIHVAPTGLADIPVHARYGEPGETPHTITIPSPARFWACPSPVSSFSSEAPVANSTMLGSFTHFSVPSMSSHYAVLQVPVALKRDVFLVEIGTAAVVLIAFLWLAYRSWRAAIALQSYHLKEH